MIATIITSDNNNNNNNSQMAHCSTNLLERNSDGERPLTSDVQEFPAIDERTAVSELQHSSNDCTATEAAKKRALYTLRTSTDRNSETKLSTAKIVTHTKKRETEHRLQRRENQKVE